MTDGKTRDVCTALSCFSKVYGWLRDGRKRGLAIVMPGEQMGNVRLLNKT